MRTFALDYEIMRKRYDCKVSSLESDGQVKYLFGQFINT